MQQSASFSFSDFRATAHIDYITIARPTEFRSWYKNALEKAHKEGRVELPSHDRNRRVTIHEPCKDELQCLIDSYWAIEILELEISVDFKPRTNSQRQAKLEWLHRDLTTSLNPEDHALMVTLAQGKWKRKYLNPQTRRYELDSMRTKAGNRTVIWEKRRGTEQVRLYIKGPDRGWPVENHFVRLEATLDRGGCQNALVHRLALLPDFMQRSRQYLSPLFQVAIGIKPATTRIRTKKPHKAALASLAAEQDQIMIDCAWQQYGAAWAIKHGRKLIPHIQANRMLGKALKDLREQLMTLKLPPKVAENPGLLDEYFHIYQPLTDSAPPAL